MQERPISPPPLTLQVLSYAYSAAFCGGTSHQARTMQLSIPESIIHLFDYRRTAWNQSC